MIRGDSGGAARDHLSRCSPTHQFTQSPNTITQSPNESPNPPLPNSPNTTVRVALTQMACGEDAERQPGAAGRVGRAGRGDGAQNHLHPGAVSLEVLLSGRGPPIFSARGDDPRTSTEAFRKIAEKHEVVVVASLFERRAAGCITTPPPSSTRMGRCSGSIGRCTSRTIRSITRSSISPLAIRAFARGRRSTPRSAC